MNKIQANMLLNMIKAECDSHGDYCVECPFEVIDDEGQTGCYLEEGFSPEAYNDKILGKRNEK